MKLIILTFSCGWHAKLRIYKFFPVPVMGSTSFQIGITQPHWNMSVTMARTSRNTSTKKSKWYWLFDINFNGFICQKYKITFAIAKKCCKRQGADSIYGCHLMSKGISFVKVRVSWEIGNPIIKIRWSWDDLIFIINPYFCEVSLDIVKQVTLVIILFWSCVSPLLPTLPSQSMD